MAWSGWRANTAAGRARGRPQHVPRQFTAAARTGRIRRSARSAAPRWQIRTQLHWSLLVSGIHHPPPRAGRESAGDRSRGLSAGEIAGSQRRTATVDRRAAESTTSKPLRCPGHRGQRL